MGLMLGYFFLLKVDFALILLELPHDQIENRGLAGTVRPY